MHLVHAPHVLLRRVCHADVVDMRMQERNVTVHAFGPAWSGPHRCVENGTNNGKQHSATGHQPSQN